jgi:hypothetical protein
LLCCLVGHAADRAAGQAEGDDAESPVAEREQVRGRAGGCGAVIDADPWRAAVSGRPPHRWRARLVDRKFRPTSNRVRQRWERLDLAQRRGVSLPPIDVYRVGDLHFVMDGHHRVSVAVATGHKTIEAHVTEVLTRIRTAGTSRCGDPLLKSRRVSGNPGPA